MRKCRNSSHPSRLRRVLRHCVASRYISLAESESESVAVGTSPGRQAVAIMTQQRGSGTLLSRLGSVILGVSVQTKRASEIDVYNEHRARLAESAATGAAKGKASGPHPQYPPYLGRDYPCSVPRAARCVSARGSASSVRSKKRERSRERKIEREGAVQLCVAIASGVHDAEWAALSHNPQTHPSAIAHFNAPATNANATKATNADENAADAGKNANSGAIVIGNDMVEEAVRVLGQGGHASVLRSRQFRELEWVFVTLIANAEPKAFMD
ncbi:hypothetical protein C8R45DRAFT_1065810 [Mycena sanguinolenta]|nr:hypothetical protein C8R45DRAFT_1065810 [Mycena sanguinolenta]